MLEFKWIKNPKYIERLNKCFFIWGHVESNPATWFKNHSNSLKQKQLNLENNFTTKQSTLKMYSLNLLKVETSRCCVERSIKLNDLGRKTRHFVFPIVYCDIIKMLKYKEIFKENHPKKKIWDFQTLTAIKKHLNQLWKIPPPSPPLTYESLASCAETSERVTTHWACGDANTL